MRKLICEECGNGFETAAARAPFCSMGCRLRAGIDVKIDVECWPWTKFTHRGYGRVTSYDMSKKQWKTERAHRLVYELAIGPIAEGLVVRHKCDNPCCCNPCHLTLGSQADNLTDMARKGRGGRKIDSQIAAAIRDDPRVSRETAKAFGVSASLVKQIRAGTVWASARA